MENNRVNSRQELLTTVIIPNYNGMEFIENCLDSIYSGSKIPSVIVVDNGSGDGSRELVEQKYPDAVLIGLKENTGFSNAVNVGIKRAETKYVFLLNNDTTIDEKCVEELERMMEGSERCFSAGAKMINMKFPEKIDDAGDFYCALGWAFSRGKDKAASKYPDEGRIFAACGGAAIYRKDLFDTVGLFDEVHFAYLEDIDVGYRANILGFHNYYAPKAIVYHAGSGVSGSRHNPFKVDLSARNSIYLIYKNMPAAQIVLNLPFLLAGYLIKLIFFIKMGMGQIYINGIKKGFALSLSEAAVKKKVKFKVKNLPCYLWIQWELWYGMVLRII